MQTIMYKMDSTENDIQYPTITIMKKYEKEYIYIYTQPNNFAI